MGVPGCGRERCRGGGRGGAGGGFGSELGDLSGPWAGTHRGVSRGIHGRVGCHRFFCQNMQTSPLLRVALVLGASYSGHTIEARQAHTHDGRVGRWSSYALIFKD